MEVTTDDLHDSKALPSLMEEASKRRKVVKAYMDSSYDSSKTYLEAKGIEAVVKPRSNSRADRCHQARREAVKLFKELGLKAWTKLKQYSERWMVETVFFKRLFGEYCLSKEPINIVKELMAKAYIYNMLINM